MTRPLRAALPALLLLASPAFGQSSLGQAGSLPPPRAAAPVAPTAAPTPPAAPEAARPRPPAAAKAAEAKPEKAPEKAAARPAAPPEKPADRRAAPVAEKPAEKPPAHATPTVQPKPGSTAAKPATPAAAARRKPAPAAAAATAAGVAAGAAAVALPAPVPAAPPRPSLGPATGLPLPRFAALGSNQVNLRIGPDLRYKIEWTYQRKDLPVQIVEEHENWRRIRDPEGTEGWVQRPLLTSRRSFLVQGEERVLRSRPEPEAAPVARLKPGVIGTIRRCEAESAWCEARVGDYRGWIRRSEVWGVAPDEAVN
ncbi:SH3 domain-containing protein [Roseicella frigidaeris]|uniref:SH3 domain-containing protein n=1 Tax=Roseicella frigidaeris TaxID=2230885 RepID=UPI000FDF5EC2|nr:SH3 domain-containing protein [Roseicella frigidaeris]